MKYLLLYYMLQVEENSTMEFFKNLFSDYPRFQSIVISILFVGAVLLWVLRNLKTVQDGLEVLKKWFSKGKKKEDSPIINDSLIKYEKLVPITNPKNEYVQNGNVEGLLEVIRKSEMGVITVYGPAGVGKTRLVQYLCNNVLNEEYKTKIYVDFEAVNSPESIATNNEDDIFEDAKSQINTALGGIDRADYHNIAKDFQTPTILFIDNYEQILDNPRLHNKIWKNIIMPFTEANRLIKIIVTSREEIVKGSSCFEVKCLENITPDQVKDYSRDELFTKFSAIKLFCKIHNQLLKNRNKPETDRIQFEDFELPILVELCNAVSNIPLGIHLIASRSVNTNLSEIKGELQYYLNRPIPDIFNEFGNRHSNLYNVFNWSFNGLTEEEKKFYKHLVYYQNGFFIENLPAWGAFSGRKETEDVIDNLYRKSFLREQSYEGASKSQRYEIYVLFKELLILEDVELIDKLNSNYLDEIHIHCHTMLKYLTDQVFGKAEDLNYTSIKIDLRLEYENITYFIEKSPDHQLKLAVDMLVMLEHLLNEVGPYLKLESLFNILLNRVSDPIQRARLLMCKARVIKSSENRSLSIQPIKQSLDLLHERSEIDEILGEAYRIGTYLSNQLSNDQLSKYIFDKVFNLTKSEQLRLGNLNLAFILCEKAKIMEQNGEIQEAIYQFNEVIALMDGHKVQQGRVFNSLGMLNWRLGNADTAIECYHQAINKYKGIGEDRWILGFQTNLGLVYCDKGDLDASKEITHKAYETLKYQGPFGWAQINLLNSGRIISRRYPKKDKYFKEAEDILLNTLEEFRLLQYWETYVLNGTDLAELYYKYDKYQEASKYIKITIAKAKEKNLTKYMRYFRVLCLSGLVNYKEGDKVESAKRFKEASEVLESIKTNKWLTYEITNLRYEQLKDLHE